MSRARETRDNCELEIILSYAEGIYWWQSSNSIKQFVWYFNLVIFYKKQASLVL